MPPTSRWLVKDVDFFAGFAHAIHTYLSGVALAHYHNMSLLHMPFQSAHGMGFHFDDFMMGDDRGLVAPLAAPELVIDRHARLLISGREHRVATVQRTSGTAQVAAKLHKAPSDSVTWVKKGRQAFADENATLCFNCTVTPESRYTALWMRERFWRAARARERAQAAAAPTAGRRRDGAMPSATRGGGGESGGSAANASTITVAIHVRRGDVTYLDKYGRPSARCEERPPPSRA